MASGREMLTLDVAALPAVRYVGLAHDGATETDVVKEGSLFARR
jgi:hypothetical protein